MEGNEGQDRAKRYKIGLIFARNVRNHLTQHGNPWTSSCVGELNRSDGHLHPSCNVSGVHPGSTSPQNAWSSAMSPG